jgi:thiamine-phosphate pyrophosphorylase
MTNHLRILDANLNRLREGIRVIEDICRFILNDKTIASQLKDLRHKSRIKNYQELLNSRDIKNDVLKSTTKSEQTRDNISSILISNFKRTQESARVLEEFCKLTDSALSQTFKNIRYELYDLEKKVQLNYDN